jgi:quinol monooxygenase YgiN
VRTITLRYKFSGPEDEWRKMAGDFIAAVDADAEVAGKFTYQVSVADDRETRIHWGRWDSQETLQKLQSRDYFKAFAARVKELAGQTDSLATNVVLKTGGW